MLKYVPTKLKLDSPILSGCRAFPGPFRGENPGLNGAGAAALTFPFGHFLSYSVRNL